MSDPFDAPFHPQDDEGDERVDITVASTRTLMTVNMVCNVNALATPVTTQLYSASADERAGAAWAEAQVILQ